MKTKSLFTRLASSFKGLIVELVCGQNSTGTVLFLTDQGFLLGFSEALIFSILVAFAAISIYISTSKVCMKPQGKKLILSFMDAVAWILASCCLNSL